MLKALCRAVVPALVVLFAAMASATPPATTDGTVPSADGVPIHYAVTGDGPVALIFVHGWSCDGTFWARQVATFAPKYRVVTVDLAGHGQSGCDRKEWKVPAFGLDVKAVVDALQLEQVVLIGHSMGGPVALAAAAALPGRIVGIIGVDTLQDAAREFPPSVVEAALAGMQADFPGFVIPYVRGMFHADADSAIVARVVGTMASAPPAIAIPVFRGLREYDLKAAFTAAKAPIRAINSDRMPTNVEGNRTFAPDFDVVIFRGAGHFLHLDRPVEFDRALEGILAKLTAKEPAR